jgi:hypothetical protein
MDPWHTMSWGRVPRFKPKAMLERSATADSFKNSLSRIPTTFGRLVYLASLRDTHTGTYEHFGLRSIFGKEESRNALSASHRRLFQEWLNLPLREKTQDLQAYLDALDEPVSTVLQHWTETEIYRSYIPAHARKSETQLFLQELEILREIVGSNMGRTQSA